MTVYTQRLEMIKMSKNLFTWVKKMFPYLLIILWMIAVTFFVVRNTSIINQTNISRDETICNVENKLKTDIDKIIVGNITNPNSQLDHDTWVKLRITLKAQLKPYNCETITPRQLGDTQ